MFSMILSGFVFGILLLACLPSARMQRAVLAVLQPGLHLTAVAAVLASSVFFFRPDLATESLAHGADVIAGTLNDVLPGAPRGAVWLPLAGLFVTVALPVLTIIDFAKRLAAHSVMVQRLLVEIRSTTKDREAALASADPKRSEPAPAEVRPSQNVKAAVETMSAITTGGIGPRTQRRPLTDFLR